MRLRRSAWTAAPTLTNGPLSWAGCWQPLRASRGAELEAGFRRHSERVRRFASEAAQARRRQDILLRNIGQNIARFETATSELNEALEQQEQGRQAIERNVGKAVRQGLQRGLARGLPKGLVGLLAAAVQELSECDRIAVTHVARREFGNREFAAGLALAIREFIATNAAFGEALEKAQVAVNGDAQALAQGWADADLRMGSEKARTFDAVLSAAAERDRDTAAQGFPNALTETPATAAREPSSDYPNAIFGGFIKSPFDS